MAASFPRPDPSSPASIAEASFGTSRRGYSTDEVRSFLQAVSAELIRLQERERQLQGELALAKSQPPQAADLDDEAMTRIVGDETVRVLQTARESASLIRARAEENASRLVSEANDEANRMRQEIEVEVSRKRKDAMSDAEAEVAMAKQQGREMVNEARAYRERVLSDLDRRTKLARHQIEELAHGRDRLLQVFERARLVAVDVTTELQALDGPTELVNLAPTTGPVPLMVPRQRLTASDAATDASLVDAAPSGHDVAVDLVDVDVDLDLDDDSDGDGGDRDEADSVVTEFPDTVNVVLAADDDEDAPTDSETTDPDLEGEFVPLDAESDEVDEVEEVDFEVDGEEAAAVPRNDGNVVNLFRGREPEVIDVTGTDADAETDAQADDVDSEPGLELGVMVEATDETVAADRPDVGGIFERLRHAQETVGSEAVSADLDEQELVPSTPFTRRDEAIVPLIVGAARKLKRVLADEQNGVLDALRSNEPVTSIDTLLPSSDAHAAAYLAVLSDDMIIAAVAGAGDVGVADTAALHKTLRRSGATNRAQELVQTGMVESLRHRIARCVSDGGGDNTDVTRRVRSVYREWKTQHIDDQLDDVFRFAYAGGLTAMIEPGTSVVWSLDPGKVGCADCEDNSLSGAVAVGTEFPTGHVAAPAHPGCRCLTLPAPQ
ncbi:MAG TPA: DivIVA domain-containing protein [Ilumatobacter sp.]|nr:DivIVA domain-containing protein [Ilumatobacter sp.]